MTKRIIKLGDKVKCKYTGFIGIAVARTEYINKCVQFTVAPKVGKDNKYSPDEICIDEESLEVVVISKPINYRKYVSRSGGPTKLARVRKGY